MAKEKGVLRSLDYFTVLVYVLLLAGGWMSVCGASYTYGEPSEIFSLASRSGMQIVWIGTSLVLGLVLLLLDDRLYGTFAYFVYGLLVVLLFATIFNPHSIKGSHSWLVIGPLRLQPAEFAKFATALALAKFMGGYGYDIHRTRDFAVTLLLIAVPMACIVLQRETGSALVYLSFFLMLYREGMSGSVLFTGVALVVYFVVGIRFADVALFATPTSVGMFAVLLMVQLFSSVMTGVYCRDWREARLCGGICLAVTVAALLFAVYVIPFNLVWVQAPLCAALVCRLVWQALGATVSERRKMNPYWWIAAFAIGSLVFYSSADYALDNVLQDHQRTRIKVLLGLVEDPRGVGYNVHQSEIAIGSGGLGGKGFLNGTQTKLKYVPEQDTDFIFCTVGEEEGFLGAAGVLLLFLALVLRLIHLSERQSGTFGRVYGYCVLSVFLFHVFINVGMVLGLTPVIGIPLPFFSYGGSSLWGFTILLFIFLRIDAGRNLIRDN